MIDKKKEFIAREVTAVSLNFLGGVNHHLSAISTKRIRLGCDYADMTDQQILANLHGIKLDLIAIGKFAYEAAESIKKHIDSNPDQPDLPLTNEDLLDDNPVEGIDY